LPRFYNVLAWATPDGLKSLIMMPRRIVLSLILICGTFAGPALSAGKSPAKVSTIHPLAKLRSGLDSIFQSTQFSNALWGVKIASLDRDEILYERNAERLLMPASNNKILTVSAALLSLGPEFRYQTQVLEDGPVIGTCLKGNLVIVGNGDPSLAARFHNDDPFSVFKEWAAHLKEKGIRSIEGAIFGEEGAFEEKDLGNGWEVDDLTYGYAAPISSFQFNENQIQIEISPGEQPGSPARLNAFPLMDYLQVKNRIITLASGSESSIQVDRTADGESVVLRGTISYESKPIVRPVAVRYPTLYYLQALKKTLASEGVDVGKCETKTVRGLNTGAMTPLWTQSSLPLSEIVKPLLKTSQNLYAETLARTMGLALRHEGSFAAGKEIVEDELSRMDIKKGSYVYADASGLSRQNLVSPDLILTILRFVSKQDCFQIFYDALSIASVDGTLEERMRGTRAANNVHAKSGAFSGARAISGYVRTSDGEMVAFSMICNNFLPPGKAVETAQDAALNLLASFNRGGKPAEHGSNAAADETLAHGTQRIETRKAE
jgi:serine-type D-Ala-D-Ala carboxypeptidase/endopeptidase (penicillin-binding protein 4)